MDWTYEPSFSFVADPTGKNRSVSLRTAVVYSSSLVLGGNCRIVSAVVARSEPRYDHALRGDASEFLGAVKAGCRCTGIHQ
jgi:hypothetical protein